MRHRAPGRPNTLYFEAEHEDELRKVGYSKERRVDPQIIVGGSGSGGPAALGTTRLRLAFA